MKKLFFLIILGSLAIVYSADAQIRKIPAEVTNAFSEKYGDAKNVEWSDKLSYFAVNFESDGKKCEARYNSKGLWQETATELQISDLPREVKDGFEKSKYADWEARSVYKVEKPKNKTEYLVRVAKSSVQQKNLLFSDKGKLLKDNITI